jgi:5-aminolevulinate synthase
MWSVLRTLSSTLSRMGLLESPAALITARCPHLNHLTPKQRRSTVSTLSSDHVEEKLARATVSEFIQGCPFAQVVMKSGPEAQQVLQVATSAAAASGVPAAPASCPAQQQELAVSIAQEGHHTVVCPALSTLTTSSVSPLSSTTSSATSTSPSTTTSPATSTSSATSTNTTTTTTSQSPAPLTAPYANMITSALEDLHASGRYRTFHQMARLRGAFPRAHHEQLNDEVTMWCSNDYLGMGESPLVLDAMHAALEAHGAGSGGTRNISGTTPFHVQLEEELASLHCKEAAMLYGSCYVANSATVQALVKLLPGCELFSDQKNHASIIEGVRQSGASKHVFRHNDLAHLEQLLARSPRDAPKIVLFESVYSMDGTVAPIEAICDLAQRYGAFTFVDEVHAVGLYGERGGGIAQQLGLEARLDLVSGTLGKAFGVYGGYVSGDGALLDALRHHSSGYTFTTSLPPMVAAGALASVRHLKHSQTERQQHRRNTQALRNLLLERGLPLMSSPSHILPLLVGDARLCKRMSDWLLHERRIYVQPINFPTVPVGTERFRLTPSPVHSHEMMIHLADSLQAVFAEFDALPRGATLDFYTLAQTASSESVSVADSFLEVVNQ